MAIEVITKLTPILHTSLAKALIKFEKCRTFVSFFAAAQAVCLYDGTAPTEKTAKFCETHKSRQ